MVGRQVGHLWLGECCFINPENFSCGAVQGLNQTHDDDGKRAT